MTVNLLCHLLSILLSSYSWISFALNCKTDPAAFRLKDFCCLVHLPNNRLEYSRRDNASLISR